MRRYLNFGLSARKVIFPMWGIMLIPIVASLLLGLTDGVLDIASGATIVNGHFVLFVLAVVAIAWLAMVGRMALALPFVQTTLRAASLEQESVETEYDKRAYMRMVAVGSLLSIITCGLYAPWFLVRVVRFFASGASYSRRLFGFRARPMALFATVTLAYVLPLVLMMTLLMAVWSPGLVDILGEPQLKPLFIIGDVIFVIVCVVWLSLLCVLLTRWMLNMNIGDRAIVNDISVSKATLYVFGQMIVTVLTLGLYAPMMELRTMQYFASTVTVGEGRQAERFGMVLRSWRDWAYVWGQLLLVIITLGIYMPWYYTKILNRFIPRLYLTSEK